MTPMWLIRAYSDLDDELVIEVPLPRFALERARTVLGKTPTAVGSTTIERGQARDLAEQSGGDVNAIPAEGVSLFLDRDADPDEATAPSARTGHARTAV